MASPDQTPQKPTKLRELLNLLMAAFSVVFGMIAILRLVLAIQESMHARSFSLSNPLLGFCFALVVGSIVLARLARLKPVHLIGSACVGGLLLSVLFGLPPHGDPIASPQAAAVGSLRTLNTAEITYYSTYLKGYSPTLSCLGEGPGGVPTATAAGLIDSILAGSGNTSEENGYRFVYKPGPRDEKGQINSYSITASPIQPGVTGTNYFYTDQTGVIRQNSTAPASSADTPLAG